MASSATTGSVVPTDQAGNPTPEQVQESSQDFIKSLPQWMQPGVSPAIHTFLKVLLLVLNGFLLYCAAAHILSPHFEIMFILSTGLTSCYFVLMKTIADIGRDAASESGHGSKSQPSESSVLTTDTRATTAAATDSTSSTAVTDTSAAVDDATSQQTDMQSKKEN